MLVIYAMLAVLPFAIGFALGRMSWKFENWKKWSAVALAAVITLMAIGITGG
jgi:membrane protein YdbS with pleckstrin-like domain